MPQEFQVLRCYQCFTFQVHQVKKAKKWNCKLCGEKQSVIKVFCRGTGADCRHHVQRLNSLRGENEEARFQTAMDVDLLRTDDFDHTSQTQISEDGISSMSSDRWSRFVTPDDRCVDEETPCDDERFTTDRAEWMSSRRQMSRKRKRISKKYDDNEDDVSVSSPPEFTSDTGCYGGTGLQSRQSRDDNSPDHFHGNHSHQPKSAHFYHPRADNSPQRNRIVSTPQDRIGQGSKWGKYETEAEKDLCCDEDDDEEANEIGNGEGQSVVGLIRIPSQGHTFQGHTFQGHTFQGHNGGQRSKWGKYKTETENDSHEDKNEYQSTGSPERDFLSVEGVTRIPFQGQTLQGQSTCGGQGSKWQKYKNIECESDDNGCESTENQEIGNWQSDVGTRLPEKVRGANRTTVQGQSKWEKYQEGENSSEENLYAKQSEMPSVLRSIKTIENIYEQTNTKLVSSVQNNLEDYAEFGGQHDQLKEAEGRGIIRNTSGSFKGGRGVPSEAGRTGWKGGNSDWSATQGKSEVKAADVERIGSHCTPEGDNSCSLNTQNKSGLYTKESTGISNEKLSADTRMDFKFGKHILDPSSKKGSTESNPGLTSLNSIFATDDITDEDLQL